MNDFDSALDRAAAAPRLLVASDFDGTLSHLVDDPDEARPVAGATAALEHLSNTPRTVVAVVSGRTLDDLERLLEGLDRVVLVGEHGAIWSGRPTSPPEGLAETRQSLKELAAGVDGAWVEAKQTTLTLHTRRCSHADEAALFERAEELLGVAAPGRHARGSHVIDVRFSDVTKADAVAELRAEVDAVLFVGDDTTDESVFEATRPGDVMVKVGDGPTAAPHRVDGPEDVVHMFERLAAAREGDR